MIPKTRRKKSPVLKNDLLGGGLRRNQGIFFLFSKWLVPPHSSGLRANHFIGETLT